MNDAIILRIIKTHYHLPPITNIKEVQLGIANRSFIIETETQPYFLQFNRLDGEFVIELAHFQYKASLLHWLKTEGFHQIVAPIETIDGQLCVQPANDGITYTLYDFRPHQIMYSEDPNINEKAATSLTDTIAHLHNISYTEPSLVGQSRGDVALFLNWLQAQRQTFQQIQQAFSQFPAPAPIRETMANTFARLDAYYQIIYHDPDIFALLNSLNNTRCLVHDDLNPTNLSFTLEGDLETLYDFDNAHWDVRAADLAYIYFYHYYSSPSADQDYFDDILAEKMFALYEVRTNSKILPEERHLIIKLTLAHILRAFLWLAGNLLKGTPLPVIAHGASRLRPQPGLLPATSPEEAVAQTFNITLNVAEAYANHLWLKG